MQKPTIIDQLHKAVAAACAPIGIRKTDIIPSARGLSIPSHGIVMTLKLSGDTEKTRSPDPDKGRVWHVVEHFSILPFGEDEERKAVRILFEAPFGSEWTAAKRLAMTLAERRIDTAIDAAIG